MMVAAPWPVGGVIHEFGPDWVQAYVARNSHQLSICSNRHRVESALEDMSGQTMSMIEVLTVGSVQCVHCFRQIGVNGLDHKVEMVGHQAVGMDS